MNISEIAIEKKVITYLFTLLLLAGGIWGFSKIGRLEDPDFTITKVRISTPYPGATAQEVEEEVSDLVEEYVQRLPQVDKVLSTSTDNASIVTVDYKKGYSGQEYRQLYDELRRKMSDLAPYLPPGAGPVIVNDDFKDVYGVYYAVSGDDFSKRELYDFARTFQKHLLLVDGVAKVSLWGEPQEVIYVSYSRGLFVKMGISDALFAQLLQQQNVVVESGELVESGNEFRFRLSGGFDSLDSLRNLRISVSDNQQIRLGDIVRFERGYADPPSRLMSYNGEESIGVGVSVDTTLNVVEIGTAIDKAVREIKQETPIGMEVNKIFNQSLAVEKAVNGFLLSLAESVLIVTLLLLFFMGVQSGVIIGLMLVLIVFGTLFFMNLFGITLQRISLGALVIAMGMLVDNSIVVTEGILVRLTRGEKAKEASLAVLKQTTWPLFGATLVAIFAFAAVGLSPDSTGEYTKTLFWVIIISLLLSWLLAITLNPLICIQFMHAPKKRADKKSKAGEANVAESSQNNNQEKKEPLGWYKKSLFFCLVHKKGVALMTVALLVVSFIGFRFVPSAFFPDSSQPQFTIDYWMPEGTNIEKTNDDILKIARDLLDKEKYPQITKVTTFAGSGSDRFQLAFGPELPSSRYGMLLVEVDDYTAIDKLRPEIQRYLDTNYPDALAQYLKFQLGPGSKGTVRARILGEDTDELRRLAKEVQTIINDSGNGYAIRTDWGEKRKIIQIEIDEQESLRLGISRAKILETLKRAFNGERVGLFRERDLLIPIIARPTVEEREGIQQLQNVYLYSDFQKAFVPLSQIVTRVYIDWQDARILRRNRIRTIEIIADPIKGFANDLRLSVQEEIENIELPRGYEIEWGGQYEDSNNAQKGIKGTFPVAFLAMLLTIFVLWNRVRQPIIIFLSIPLSIIGVVLGLLMTGVPFSFMSLMGLLALFGMVIKNAIVMVDEIDIYIRKGVPPFDAIIDACITRVRPVLLTALSTVLGMLPLLTDSFFQGMAVTIMFGLTIASGITLIVTPVLYALFFHIKPPKTETTEE